jgi:hypothetical protein
MRSQLTRNVFRRLLSNEPLVYCRRASHPQYRHAVPRITRRSLWGFTSKLKREPREPQLDPGLSRMLELSSMDRIQARPPPASQLASSFITFLEYKYRVSEPMNKVQAQHVLRTFKHLQKENTSEEGFGLTLQNLRCAIRVTALMPNDTRETHKELGREIYAEIEKRTNETVEEGNFVDAKFLIMILVQSGETLEARELLQNISRRNEGNPRARKDKHERRLWLYILEGFAREDNEVELLKAVEMAEQAGVQTSSRDFVGIMTSFYARKDNVEETKKWYGKHPQKTDITQEDGRKLLPLHTIVPSPETVATILRFSIRNNELEWCKTVFQNLLETNPKKETWDVVFQWAAGALGKGVEDVEHMMHVMIKHNSNDETMRPDIDTINGLVDLAMSLKDPYLAERYLALGQKFNIRPNARTYILQMNYRVSAGDLTGAQTAYTALQSEEINNNEDLPAINTYIRALCAAKSPNYNLITELTSDLDDRHLRLEASTVSALCMFHLNLGETPEALDLLHTQTYHYSLPERISIRDSFLSFCLDPSTPTGRSWEAYSVMRQVFEETPIDIRTQIMNDFFSRGRSDMAVYTFGHMRAHIRPSHRPILSTYIECFEGIASCADRESLDIVHNMLKMDSSIEPNTKLYNSLMLAYTACEDSDKALDFWDDITLSAEGPSYRSLEIVFHACRRKAFGDRRAREVWSKMLRMGIEVTEEVFRAYVGCMAGNSKVKEAQELVEGGEKEFGHKPDWKM